MTLYDLTVDVLAAALPDVMSEATSIEVMGPDVHRLDVADEWYMSPREMATQILEKLQPVIEEPDLEARCATCSHIYAMHDTDNPADPGCEIAGCDCPKFHDAAERIGRA